MRHLPAQNDTRTGVFMGLLAGQDGAVDGYEPVPLRPDLVTAPQPGAVMFRRLSPHPSRRAVLHLQTARDASAPPDLARWFTERGFHFYVAALRWPGGPRKPWQRPVTERMSGFAEIDDRCAHLRTTDGIDNILVTAHGEGALAAALWCDAQRDAERFDIQPPGGRADALILYTPAFGGSLRRGLDIQCPVLVIGEPLPQVRGGRSRRAEPAAAVGLGRHVTWLRPTDGEARPDAQRPEDRARFFDEMGRWLGAYMYGQVRDTLL
jgi:alpha-beta hydrolase superfamily lysophospholipase